jgi:hypothetical protein
VLLKSQGGEVLLALEHAKLSDVDSERMMKTHRGNVRKYVI